jgi:anti-sigma28 factor (negative regulator of flagellin synthesis)
MNIKIQSDRISGADALSNAPGNQGSRVNGARGTAAGDSVAISDLSARIAESIGLDDAKAENRVSELAALYAGGKYQVDAGALSRSMISQAIQDEDGVEL